MRAMERKLIDTHWNGVQRVELSCLCYMCVVVLHTAELNRLVAMLDDRVQKSAKNSFHRKERVEKSPSAAPPPADAPSWTLKPTRERESTPPAPEPHVSMPTAGPFSTEEDSSESD